MYITNHNIIDYLGEQTVIQLTDDNGFNQINHEILTNIINQVNNYIDDNLRGGYNLPLKNTHSILYSIAIDLVKYELYKRRDALSDSIKDTFKKAMDDLSKITKGIIKLNEGVVKPIFIYEKKKNIW